MADFGKALNVVLINEGGQVNDADDHGGATNMGISAVSSGLSDSQIAALTPEQVEDIYRTRYWQPLKLDQVNHNGLAMVIFDQAVLRGPIKICKVLQKIVNTPQDGLCGQKTIDAINAHSADDLIFQTIAECINHNSYIVMNDASQSKFLDGWNRRCLRLFKTAQTI